MKTVEDVCRARRPTKPYISTDMWSGDGKKIFLPDWAYKYTPQELMKIWEMK